MATGSSRIPKWLGIIIGVVFGLFIVIGIIGNVIRGGAHDPLADAMSAELDRQGMTQALHDRVAKTADTTAARHLGADFARKGIARLPEDLLAEREGLLLHLDSIAGDTLCAGHFMGTLTPAQLHGFVGLLDSTQLARWAHISVSAMKAELEATEPVAPLGPNDLAETLQSISAQLRVADQERFKEIFANLPVATIADQCWASRTTTAAALGMRDPEREVVLRKMAIVEAGL